MAQPEARSVAQRLALRTVPAVVIDGRLVAVGVQPLHMALELVADAPPKKRSAGRFVGITLAAPGRMALWSAAAYLLLAGLPLAMGGIDDARALAASLHVDGLGFAALTIFGLAEHMLPRFMGRPVRLGVAAWMQQALAHAGVIALAGGLLLDNPAARVAGSAALLLALCAFALRMLPLLFPRGEDSGAG
jgi:hypothetical protein